MAHSVRFISHAGHSCLLVGLFDTILPPSEQRAHYYGLQNKSMHYGLMDKEEQSEPNTLFIRDTMDLYKDHKGIEVIRMNRGVCNHIDIEGWNICEFVSLKELIVGDNCVRFVKQFKLIGLMQLEKVEIGSNSFKAENDCTFEVIECNSLKEVTIGDNCFVHAEKIEFNS